MRAATIHIIYTAVLCIYLSILIVSTHATSDTCFVESSGGGGGEGITLTHSLTFSFVACLILFGIILVVAVRDH